MCSTRESIRDQKFSSGKAGFVTAARRSARLGGGSRMPRKSHKSSSEKEDGLPRNADASASRTWAAEGNGRSQPQALACLRAEFATRPLTTAVHANVVFCIVLSLTGWSFDSVRRSRTWVAQVRMKSELTGESVTANF